MCFPSLFRQIPLKAELDTLVLAKPSFIMQFHFLNFSLNILENCFPTHIQSLYSKEVIKLLDFYSLFFLMYSTESRPNPSPDAAVPVYIVADTAG